MRRYLPLIALTIALPVLVLGVLTVIRLFPRAFHLAAPASVRIHPGEIVTVTNGNPIYMSTLAFDSSGNPIFDGITYEWGISSDSSVGTLVVNPNNTKLAIFYPKNEGSGYLWVIARDPLNQATSTIKICVGQCDIIVIDSTTLNLKIKFQGLSGPGTSTKLSTVVIGSNTFTPTLTRATNGIYTTTVTGFSPGTYDIRIGSPSYLFKKFPNITLDFGITSLDLASNPLVIGDFNNDNILNISDISLLLAQYTALSNPVTPTNQIYDVNGDGIINISDVSLVLSNYTALTIYGD